ncbi:phosphatase tensin type domain-containing protein [Cavenderia fasciculata]|uniref:DNA polymerase lambda n=1 Tax=Cavenderia fasciculata TaxID=261658 RepID=F4Q5G1_CACFS|nr:phosphatase tensin type domain-containing protein [Cavenderia fasciculata]EGG17220.1 phosphatase tensin type domain-containing protein [Cavenderia fasciculata]|eukprot:XP_004355704.1 phosphatase tensin type domain-containing protein [Cavenderia fasciculata]
MLQIEIITTPHHFFYSQQHFTLLCFQDFFFIMVKLTLVSGQKKRFTNDGFNLDLGYITERIIAMGYPADSLAKVIRNDISHVYDFFETYHKDHWKILNVAREISYKHTKLGGNVVIMAFEDHSPPPFLTLLDIIDWMDQWLSSDQRNVVAIHCKAGKVSCYLIYMLKRDCQEIFDTSDSILLNTISFFNSMRSINGQPCVTVPSQKRYIGYYISHLKGLVPKELIIKPPLYKITSIEICSNSFITSIELHKNYNPNIRSLPLIFHKNNTIIIGNDKYMRFELKHIIIQGDTMMKFNMSDSNTCVCRLFFHTSFVTPPIDTNGNKTTSIVFPKMLLDGPSHGSLEDSSISSKFKPDFQINLHLEAVNEPLQLSSQQQQIVYNSPTFATRPITHPQMSQQQSLSSSSSFNLPPPPVPDRKIIMFKNNIFYINKKGIGRLQQNIIQTKIISNGGTICQHITTLTTHILVQDSTSIIDPITLSSDFKDLILSKSIVGYTINWLTLSIQKGEKIIDDAKFLIPLHYQQQQPIDQSTPTKKNVHYNEPIDDITTRQLKRSKNDSFSSSSSSSLSFLPTLSPIKKSSSSTNYYQIPTKLEDIDINSSWLSYQSSSDDESTKSIDNSTIDYSFVSFDSDGEEDQLISQSLISNSLFTSQLPYSLKFQPNHQEEEEEESINNNNNNSTQSLIKYTKRAKGFACQKGTKINYNESITSVLEKLLEKALGDGDRWREYAYKRAIGILKGLTFKLSSSKDLGDIRGIGPKIREKIDEIIETGTLRRVESSLSDTTNQISQALLKIHGAGPNTVKNWMAAGVVSIQQLRQHILIDPLFLTSQQHIGLKYYEDFLTRIPRLEVINIVSIIENVVKELDPNIIMEVCGSFRRMKKDCGDIDILFTHSKGEILNGLLRRLTLKLESINLLTDHLTSVKSDSDKYMGVCRLGPDGLHRRIDFQTISKEEWPFALLYFTGSDHFNRSMRLWARRNGFSLSESHLVRRMGKNENEIKGDPIHASCEKDIFALLGLEYRHPQDREV